jgi:hypothetical protein
MPTDALAAAQAPAIDVATLMRLARESVKYHGQNRCDIAVGFIPRLSGILAARFGDEVADEFASAIGFDHLVSKKDRTA